jgi:hypothetical protein
MQMQISSSKKRRVLFCAILSAIIITFNCFGSGEGLSASSSSGKMLPNVGTSQLKPNLAPQPSQSTDSGVPDTSEQSPPTSDEPTDLPVDGESCRSSSELKPREQNPLASEDEHEPNVLTLSLVGLFDEQEEEHVGSASTVVRSPIAAESTAKEEPKVVEQDQRLENLIKKIRCVGLSGAIGEYLYDIAFDHVAEHMAARHFMLSPYTYHELKELKIIRSAFTLTEDFLIKHPTIRARLNAVHWFIKTEQMLIQLGENIKVTRNNIEEFCGELSDYKHARATDDEERRLSRLTESIKCEDTVQRIVANLNAIDSIYKEILDGLKCLGGEMGAMKSKKGQLPDGLDELTKHYSVLYSLFQSARKTSFYVLKRQKDNGIVQVIEAYISDQSANKSTEQFDQKLEKIQNAFDTLHTELDCLVHVNTATQIENLKQILFGKKETNEDEKTELTRESYLQLPQEELKDLLVVAKQICITALIHAEKSIKGDGLSGLICHLKQSPFENSDKSKTEKPISHRNTSDELLKNTNLLLQRCTLPYLPNEIAFCKSAAPIGHEKEIENIDTILLGITAGPGSLSFNTCFPYDKSVIGTTESPTKDSSEGGSSSLQQESCPWYFRGPQAIHIYDTILEDNGNMDRVLGILDDFYSVQGGKNPLVDDLAALAGNFPDPTNLPLRRALDQLIGYIGEGDVVLFFGSERRGYTADMMREHLRRLARIVIAAVTYNPNFWTVIGETLAENVLLGGFCAQGHRNRLVAILLALVGTTLDEVL